MGMAEAIELSFGQALRGILATLQVPDIEGDRLHDLISRVGHTIQTFQVEVNGEASLDSCPVIFVEDVPCPDTTPPCSPKSTPADGSRVLRSSDSEGPKRSYLAMQGANNGTSRSRKKSKYLLKQRLMKSSGNETATESAETLDAPSTDTPPAGTPSETAAGTADEPSTNEVSVENTAQAATDTGLHKHTSVRPSILDGSGHFLEDILRHVLEAGDTSRKPDSAVPGTIDALAKTDPAVFARLMTCAAVNWGESNRATTRAALYCEQERLREVEKARLDRIADDRVQMNVTIDERLSSEISYQQGEKRLKRSTQNAIASLNLRKEADKILLGITSEPVELTGDFRDASDLDGMIKEIEKDDAKGSKDRQRKLWKETYYWPAIQQRAKMEGPLPNPSGRKIDMSPQERLKLLSELREAGVKSLLLCRTPEFKTHFWRHPNELNMLLSWNQLYDPYLQQLRLRVIAEEGNDFSGKCDIQDENIKKRLLLLPQMMADLLITI